MSTLVCVAKREPTSEWAAVRVIVDQFTMKNSPTRSTKGRRRDHLKEKLTRLTITLRDRHTASFPGHRASSTAAHISAVSPPHTAKAPDCGPCATKLCTILALPWNNKCATLCAFYLKIGRFFFLSTDTHLPDSCVRTLHNERNPAILRCWPLD